jgi:hypothetical protein
MISDAILIQERMNKPFGLFCRSWFMLVILLLAGQEGNAQGGHYWTEQYGTRSILMSGSVIGGVEDLGAVFYNPGRLSLIENPAFLLSAKLYQLERITLLNALDDDNSLENKKFGGVPGLVAGTFKLGFMPKHHFAYALLTRQRMDYSFLTRANKEGDLFEEYPGEETFTGRLTLSSRFTDEWMSLTWSYPLKENLSIGVTTAYVSSGSMRNIEMELQLLYDDKTGVGQFLRNRLMDFNSNGLLWKFGLAWENKFMDVGITATTPKIHIKGSGNFIYEDFLSGLPDSVETNYFESSIQGDLPVTHKSPLSIGGGVTFKVFKKHLLHLSGEWYNSIPRYSILEANPFIGQSTDEERRFTMYEQHEPVFNYGAGLEFVLGKKSSIYLSYSSDYSYVPSEISRLSKFSEEASNSNFRADINHAGAGLILKLSGADITLGATRAWARESIPRPIDFPDEGEEGIFNSDDVADILWTRWRLIFSFSFPFLKDIEKKIDTQIDK